MPTLHSINMDGPAGNVRRGANSQPSGVSHDVPAGSMGLHSLLKDLKSSSTPLKKTMQVKEGAGGKGNFPSVKEKQETSPPIPSLHPLPSSNLQHQMRKTNEVKSLPVQEQLPVLMALPTKKETPPPVIMAVPAKKETPPAPPKRVFHEPTCENGHRLTFKGKSDTQWACNGRETKEGCRRGCTDFGQSGAWDCWRCDSCDFDLCDQCFADPPDFGWPTVPERTVAAAAGLVEIEERIPHPEKAVVLRAALPPPHMGKSTDPSGFSPQAVQLVAPEQTPLQPAERQRYEMLDAENQQLHKQVEILEAVQMQLHQDLTKERENVQEQQQMLAAFEKNAASREEQAMQLASFVRQVQERVELQDQKLQRQAEELETARSQISKENSPGRLDMTKSLQFSPAKEANRSGISWIGEDEKEDDEELLNAEDARRMQLHAGEVEQLCTKHDLLLARVQELEEMLSARGREATESGAMQQRQLEANEALEAEMREMAQRLAEAEIRAEDAQLNAEAVRALEEEVQRIGGEKARAEGQLWMAREEVKRMRNEVWEVVTGLDDAYVAAAREGVRLKHLQDTTRLRELELERQKQRVQSSEEDAQTVMTELQRAALDMQAFDRHHKTLQNHVEEVHAAHAKELDRIRRVRVEERAVFDGARLEIASLSTAMVRDLSLVRKEMEEILEEKPIIGQNIVAREGFTPQVKRYVDSLCEDREEALRGRLEETRRRELAEAEVAALSERVNSLDQRNGQRNSASPPEGLMSSPVQPRKLEGITLSPASEKSAELENHVGRLLGMVQQQETEVRRVERELDLRIRTQHGKSANLITGQASKAVDPELEQTRAALQLAEQQQQKAWERAAEISKQLADEKNRNQEMAVKLAVATSSST